MSIIGTLITTHQDEESYGSNDLNRVGEALSYVAGRLMAAGYSVSVSPKTDWTITDIPSPEQMSAYLIDVGVIRGALTVMTTTPDVPSDMDDLTADDANDIERVLQAVDWLISGMIAAYRHAGNYYAGQGGLGY